MWELVAELVFYVIESFLPGGKRRQEKRKARKNKRREESFGEESE